MTTLSRRTFFSLTATAAIAAPVVLRTATAAGAAAIERPEMPDEGEFKRFVMGDFEVTALSDGHRTVPDPQSIFGIDQDKAAVEKLLEENFLPTGAMQFTFAPVLINTGTELLIIDTGNGEGGREGGAGRMLESLKASGYKPEEVSLVVLTHMHGDHIGGMMEAGKPAFPNARYVSHKVEYDFWTDDARMGTKAEKNHQLAMSNVAPFAGKFTFVEEGGEVVPGITAHEAFGHTPGHTIYRVESGGRTIVLTGDTSNHFVLSLQRPEWQVSFDMDKEAATASRRKVFDMIAEERVAFIGYHMPFPAAGFVEKTDDGYRFVPVTYQFAV